MHPSPAHPPEDLGTLAEATPEDVHEAAAALREAEEDAESGHERGESEGEHEEDRVDPDHAPDGAEHEERHVAGGEEGRETGEGRGEDGEEALARGRAWWKLALYWATGTRLFTSSPSLRPDREADGPVGPDGEPLAHIPCYRYIGTARLGEFPAYILRSARVIPRCGGRPPPASAPAPPGG